MIARPRLLNDFLYEPSMSYEVDAPETWGRGVDGEAPPDNYDWLDHQIGRTERHILNGYHAAAADGILHNEAARLANQLGANSGWVERVALAAKRVNRGCPLLRVAVAAYAEGGFASEEIVHAAGRLALNVTANGLFHAANHSGLRAQPRYVLDLYPLAKVPGMAAMLNALGARNYDKFNGLYVGWVRQIENAAYAKGKKLAPRTIARMALKNAAKEFGIPLQHGALK